MRIHTYAYGHINRYMQSHSYTHAHRHIQTHTYIYRDINTEIQMTDTQTHSHTCTHRDRNAHTDTLTCVLITLGPEGIPRATL